MPFRRLIATAVVVVTAAMLTATFAPANAQGADREISRSRTLSWTATVDMDAAFNRDFGSIEGNYWKTSTTATRWPGEEASTAFEVEVERWDCPEGSDPSGGECEHRGTTRSAADGLSLRLNRRSKQATITGTVDYGGDVVQEVSWEIVAIDTPETTTTSKIRERYEWVESGTDFTSFLVIQEKSTNWYADTASSLPDPAFDVTHVSSHIEKNLYRSTTNNPIDDIPPGT